MSMHVGVGNEIHLSGDWSISGIAVQHERIVERFAALAGQQADEVQVPQLLNDVSAIDMTGIDELDACGCQLLLVFLSNLKLAGVTPALHGNSVTVRSKIKELGFDREFSVFLNSVMEAA